MMMGPPDPGCHDEHVLAIGSLHATAQTRRNSRVVVCCLGDIDAATAPALAEFLRRWTSGRCVTLDLSGTDYMDATGLNALLISRQAAADAGGHLRIGRHRSRPVHRLLAVTGVLAQFDDDHCAPACLARSTSSAPHSAPEELSTVHVTSGALLPSHPVAEMAAEAVTDGALSA